MQIPETPTRLEDLALMRRLKDYSEGTATWYLDAAPVGENARKESGKLYIGLVTLVDNALARLLDRITAREMETFTMHDRTHGNKVAHLMWHIIPTERRDRLTPPEIGMLIGAAFLHDVGMALSPAERIARLDPESDLWERLEVDESLKQSIDELRARVRDESLGETQRRRAERQLAQAEEVLLSQDTRERHASERRYDDVLDALVQMSQTDPERIPDPRAALSFDGDSFRKKLVDVCVSHGQDAESLVESDRTNAALPRFPKDYPVGCCNADLHLVAAALRLADILDFDRERTPPVLFHYLLPGPLTSAGDNRSILEWGKHLTISNWHIDDEAIVFRGRSASHIVHHAVVQFAGEIEKEIDATRATFGAFQKGDWPFIFPRSVHVDITPEGYRYVPYRFELDDERVYTLLMGGAIYDEALVAVRELIQNAVDACKLRDAMLRMHEPELEPKKDGRIKITYREPDAECANPVLIIEDTGIGMDGWILERFFLKVGRSYYRSSEFSRVRVDLRKHGLDFAPVSEFGIGFLSSFLIADQVRVETAMADSIRRDARKRTLVIDGPTRLIRMDEHDNTGQVRHRGTRVSLLLTRGGYNDQNQTCPPSWEDVEEYIEDICQDLPYSLVLVHSVNGEQQQRILHPRGTAIDIPPEWRPFTFPVSVSNEVLGFEGEVVLLTASRHRVAAEDPVKIVVDLDGELAMPDEIAPSNSGLLRGGFYVGSVPGIPKSATARIRLTWDTTSRRRYWGTNIARSDVRESDTLGMAIFNSWFRHLLNAPTEVPLDILRSQMLPDDIRLSKYNARDLYRLARIVWEKEVDDLGHSLSDWENGISGPLPCYPPGLAYQLLSPLLSAISTPFVRDSGLLWIPPVADWREKIDRPLEEVTVPIGPWAYYPDNQDALISESGVRGLFLNIRYKQRFSSFSAVELHETRRTLQFLYHAIVHSTRRVFDRDDVDVISRLVGVAGELPLRFNGDTYTVRGLFETYFSG